MILTIVVVLLHTQTTFASKAALVDCASTECVVNMGDRLFPCSSTLFGIEMGFGTLGGFFESKDMPNNERTFYAITNAHVVASGDVSYNRRTTTYAHSPNHTHTYTGR